MAYNPINSSLLTPPKKISDIYNSLFPGMLPSTGASPAPASLASVTRNLPNGAGSYQAPVPPQPTAPVPPQPPVRPTAPSAAPAAPLAQSGTPALDYSKYTDPTTGQVLTPQDYANSLAQKVTNGNIPTYAGDALTKGPQTTPELQSTATDLNNQRNDISTGATDPYGVASKSGVAYSPTEMAAIEKAYAGIYDPALKDVFAKLDKKQKEDASAADLKNQLTLQAQKHKDDVELKNMEINANDPTSSKNQDKYEQEYRQILLKPLSNRSGGLGLEDAKVNQAIHLASLINQYKDGSGNYNIPTTQYNELALGLARLISPTGTVGSEVQNSITQATATGDFNKALTYVTGTPFNGSSQEVYKNLIDTIDRQGKTAQQNRDQYMTYLQGLAPTNLDATRQSTLENNLLNQYTPITNGGNAQVDPTWLATPNYSQDIKDAQDAISQGANREAVRARLLTKYQTVNL